MRKISRRDFLKGSAAGMVTIAFSGVGLNAMAEEGTRNLIVPSSSTLSTLDSVVASNSVDMTIIRSSNEGLYRDSVDGIILSLASEDVVSEDGLTHTFTIRDDACWSNGEKITAYDFEYAWKRLANPDTGAEYAEMLLTACIKNAEEVTTGEMDVDELGCYALDESTFVVECSQYLPYFADLLIMPCFYPENQEFVEAQGDQYGMTADKVLYSGVFMVTEWEMGSDTVVLSKNPYIYDSSLSNLDTLTYQTITETSTGVMAYESGQLDVLQLTGDYLDQYADSDEIHYVNNATLYYLQPNLSNEYFANENFRLALAHALDRDSICSDILKNGSVGAGYIVVSNFAANDEGVDFRDVANATYQEYDTELALSYWETALEELGTDSASVTLLYDDADEIPTIAQFMQASLQEALPGLTIELQAQPTTKARRELMAAGDYDIALTRWGSDYNDPSTFMDLFKTGNSFNYGGYSNETYDTLVTDASGKDIMDTDTRFQEYIEAEALILNEAGIIPVWEVGRAYLIREGVHVDFTVDSGYMYQYASMD
ncbi:MAG: ABC transporter substrate-binding protein [Lachnospiraceae bacterium]|nr:ABC transporter substrate-binding protein [Lachnospiraceae bacterium]